MPARAQSKQMTSTIWQWNVIPPTPTRTRAQTGDNYAHARSAETRPFLLLRLHGPGNEATSERTFSALWRLKTFLRTSMAQDRLNHLLLLYCHKVRTDLSDMPRVAWEFLSVNERRLQYFGTISWTNLYTEQTCILTNQLSLVILTCLQSTTCSYFTVQSTRKCWNFRGRLNWWL